VRGAAERGDPVGLPSARSLHIGRKSPHQPPKACHEGRLQLPSEPDAPRVREGQRWETIRPVGTWGASEHGRREGHERSIDGRPAPTIQTASTRARTIILSVACLTRTNHPVSTQHDDEVARVGPAELAAGRAFLTRRLQRQLVHPLQPLDLLPAFLALSSVPDRGAYGACISSELRGDWLGSDVTALASALAGLGGCGGTHVAVPRATALPAIAEILPASSDVLPVVAPLPPPTTPSIGWAFGRGAVGDVGLEETRVEPRALAPLRSTSLGHAAPRRWPGLCEHGN